MPETTFAQGLPYPLGSDSPGTLDDTIQALAEAVEPKLVQVYADAATRDSYITAPSAGQFVVLTVSNTILVYDGVTWVQIYPPTGPKITSSASIPDSATGSNGDVHFQI